MQIFTETELVHDTYVQGPERTSIVLKTYVATVSHQRPNPLMPEVHSAKLELVNTNELVAMWGDRGHRLVRDFYYGLISWEELSKTF